MKIIELINKNPSFSPSPSPSSSPSSSSSSSSSSSFHLNWNNVYADILWDRVYSKFLNTWLLVISILYTLTFATSYLLPNIHWNNIIEKWFLSIVSIIYILFFGIIGTIIIIPLSIINSPKEFQLLKNRIAIILFPLISAILFTIFWVYKRDHSMYYFEFVSWLLGIIGCIGCFIYCCHILLRKTEPFVERKKIANDRYVQRLLTKSHKNHNSTSTISSTSSTSLSANTINEVTNEVRSSEIVNEFHKKKEYENKENNKENNNDHNCNNNNNNNQPEKITYYLHPIYKLGENNTLINTTTTIQNTEFKNLYNIPPVSKDQHIPYHEPFVYPEHQTPVQPVTEESTLIYFFKTFDWKRVLYEIRKDTPQLLMLGTLLGYVIVAVILGYAFTVFWVNISWSDIWNIFEKLIDPIETFVVAMNDYIQSWNNLKSELPVWIRNETTKKYFENNTEAIDNLNERLAELGFNITYDDIVQFEYLTKNLTSSTEEVIWAYSEFYSWYNDFKNGFMSFEDEFNEFKWSWNYSLLTCSIIVTLIAMTSLLWPILISCNIRRNLRSGKWRQNKRAYVSKYQVHHLTSVPGMQFGTALMSFLLFLVILSLLLFVLVYSPTRDLIWDLSRDFILTLVFALIFKELLIYLVFNCWQLDKDNNMKDIQTYSISFCVLLIFNVLYGILASIFRMLIFIGFSFIAILRIDSTMLPDEIKELDQGYYTFHSYLMFEHETKNPILRSALEVFAESGQRYVERLSNNKNSGNIYDFDSSRNIGLNSDSKLSYRPVLSHRARNRWFLAYTLISNPSLISLRRRDKLPQQSSN